MVGVSALGLGLAKLAQQVIIAPEHLLSSVLSLTAALEYSESTAIYYGSIVLITSDNMSNTESITFLPSNALSDEFMPKRLERRLSALTLFLIMFFFYIPSCNMNKSLIALSV